MLNTDLWLVNWPQCRNTDLWLVQEPPLSAAGAGHEAGAGHNRQWSQVGSTLGLAIRHGLEPLMCRLIWFMIGNLKVAPSNCQVERKNIKVESKNICSSVPCAAAAPCSASNTSHESGFFSAGNLTHGEINQTFPRRRKNASSRNGP